MILCPQCELSMNPVTVRANPGTLIQLDQCRQCGGIWCDKWELFPIDAEAAVQLDSLDEKLLTAPARMDKGILFCPRCTSRLGVCNDPLLPKDIVLQRCGRCDGIWLNRGQLSRYKNYQQKTRLEKMSAEAMVRKLPAVFQNPQSWVVTGTNGMFAYPQGLDKNDEPVVTSLGAAFKLILQILVRTLLGI